MIQTISLVGRAPIQNARQGGPASILCPVSVSMPYNYGALVPEQCECVTSVALDGIIIMIAIDIDEIKVLS